MHLSGTKRELARAFSPLSYYHNHRYCLSLPMTVAFTAKPQHLNFWQMKRSHWSGQMYSERSGKPRALQFICSCSSTWNSSPEKGNTSRRHTIDHTFSGTFYVPEQWLCLHARHTVIKVHILIKSTFQIRCLHTQQLQQHTHLHVNERIVNKPDTGRTLPVVKAPVARCLVLISCHSVQGNLSLSHCLALFCFVFFI